MKRQVFSIVFIIIVLLVVSCKPITKISATYCPEYKSENFDRVDISQKRIAIMPLTCDSGLENQLQIIEQEINNSLTSDFNQDNVVFANEVQGKLTAFDLMDPYRDFLERFETDGTINMGLMHQIGELFGVEFLLDIHLSSISRKGYQRAITDIHVESRIWDTEQGKLVWEGREIQIAQSRWGNKTND